MLLLMFALFFFFIGMYYGHLIENSLNSMGDNMLCHGNFGFDEKIQMPEKSVVYFVIHGNPLDEMEEEGEKEKALHKKNEKNKKHKNAKN